MESRYNQDLVLWTEQQGRALRAAASAGWNAPIDWENVAEEIESLGRSERRTLASHIENVLEHLLKLEASPNREPARGWRDTIRRARGAIEDVLADSPSLRREVASIVAKQTPRARTLVRTSFQDYGEQPRVDMEAVTYTEAQVLGDWLPEND
jgi:Domain of unknown function DUF29